MLKRRLGKERAQAYSLEYRLKNRAYYLIGACRSRCEKGNIPFNLDQHVAEIQLRIDKGFCEISGHPFDQNRIPGERGIRPGAPSLDRRDPKGGYVLNNIRVVCFAVNAAMSNWGEEAVLPIMEAWVRSRT